MPKNKGKGGKTRRRGKNESAGDKRELLYKEEGQEYAQVLRMLGNGRLEAYCFDGSKRLAHIRGKMQKKVWINAGDIVLMSLREYQDDKSDVIYKYTPEEARNLKVAGELPENIKINDGEVVTGDADEDTVQFVDEQMTVGADAVDNDDGGRRRGVLEDLSDDDDELDIDDI